MPSINKTTALQTNENEIIIDETLSRSLDQYNAEVPRIFNWVGINPLDSILWDLLYMLFFVIFYLILHSLIKKYANLDHLKKEYYKPQYQNILVSIFHATIASTLCTWLVITDETIYKDLFHYYNSYGKLITLHTFGYFIFDSIEYTQRNAWKREPDILAHHSIILTGAVFTLWQEQYYGYIVTGLLVEWNGILLHVRRIYLWFGRRKEDKQFKIIAWTNLITLIICRICVIAYMAYAVYAQTMAGNLSMMETIMGSLLTLGLKIVNLVLLYRVYESDISYLC